MGGLYKILAPTPVRFSAFFTRDRPPMQCSNAAYDGCVLLALGGLESLADL